MHELLVPAGNMECLQQAIMNGADAVYVGCKDFGARKFATNFTNEEMLEAIKLCHLYGVKIYVTMNTLIKDSEVERFLEQIEFLHKNSIDAVILQDFGMICLIRQMYPELEIHASTQANIASKEAAELLYKLGVKRIVFPREMTLKEVEQIDVPIEKEIFVHGALCICYSGCCLMSSMLGTRSGNRGECAGSCRLPYDLKRNGKIIEKQKYLLSTKELNTSENFEALKNSKIYSFKIEGRMKSPEYVGFITKFYRMLLDEKIDQKKLNSLNESLKTIFNRQFTKGNLFKESPADLMNSSFPNHIGLPIGKVIKITKDKIIIKLDEGKTLNQYDGIRFLQNKKGFIVNFLYDKKDRLINSSTDICQVENRINLSSNDIVCKTLDKELISSLKQLPQRKIPVKFKLTAILGKPLKLTITDIATKIEIEQTGSIVVPSKTSPTTKERITQQLSKLGKTPFSLTKLEINCDDNIFISIKELNELRRTLSNLLITKKQDISKKIIKNKVQFPKLTITSSKKITTSVKTEEQLKTCLNLNIDRIYVSDKSLYEKYEENSRIYYQMPRCLINQKEEVKERNITSDYFEFRKYKNKFIGNYGLNVYNIYTAYYLYSLGLESITLSVELTLEEQEKFITNYLSKFASYPNIEIFSYGYVENMIIKGNVLNLPINNYEYSLSDIKKRIFPVFFSDKNTHILNYLKNNYNYNCFHNSPILKHANIHLSFFDEKEKEVQKIVKRYQ